MHRSTWSTKERIRSMSWNFVSFRRWTERRHRKMNPRRKNFLSTGTPSIVLIFVLLCLLTFSVLSVVSARADLNLSTKSADRTTEYYEAENEANDILLTVRNSLASHAGSP